MGLRFCVTYNAVGFYFMSSVEIVRIQWATIMQLIRSSPMILYCCYIIYMKNTCNVLCIYTHLYNAYFHNHFRGVPPYVTFLTLYSPTPLQELEMYNPALVNKQQVVVVNKIDLLDQEAVSAIVASLKKAAGHTRVLGVSAVTGENVKVLMQRIRKLVR